MAWFRKIKAGLVKDPASEYVGKNPGEIFFDVESGASYLTDGVTPGGLPILERTVTKDYVDGLQVDAGSVGGFTKEQLTSANRTNQLIVSSLVDLPDPDVNGVITLPANIMVEPDGEVDLGTNVLQLSTGTSIIGRDPANDYFITDAPGKAVITGSGTGQTILRTFAVINLNGSAFDITTPGDVHVNIFYVGILGSTAVGTFTGGNVVAMKSCYQGRLVIPGVGTFVPSAGPVFEGNIRKVFYADSPIEDLETGGVGIRLGATLVSNTVDITRNYFKGTGGIAVVQDSAAVIDEGIFSLNALTEGVTVSSGFDHRTIGWDFSINTRAPNSRVMGGMRGSDNAQLTTINTTGTPVKAVIPTIEPAGTGFINERIEMTQDNRLAYTGVRDISLQLSTTFYLTAATNNQEIRVYYALNGTAIPSSSTTVLVGTGGSRVNGTVIGLAAATQGDYVEIWVANLTSTADATMLGMSVNVIGV